MRPFAGSIHRDGTWWSDRPASGGAKSKDKRAGGAVGFHRHMEDRELVRQITAWIEEHLTDVGAGQQLPQVSGYSPNRLRQKFYNIVGITPSGYLRRRRLTEAARAIADGQAIVEIALRFGYSSQDNFTTAFKAYFGVTPGEVQLARRKLGLLDARMLSPFTSMEIIDLKQAPLNTTLLGCVKGAAEYYDLDWTVPELFVFSSHAFMLNLHRDLCASSPYVWNKRGFQMALRNLGIRVSAEIRLDRNSSPSAGAEAEECLRQHLDAGNLCTVDFLEHQLVAGYDNQGLLVLQPWGCNAGSELASLSFGTWKEAIDREGWVQFTLLEREELMADRRMLLQQALTLALRYWDEPETFAYPNYGVMVAGWENWIAGVERGLGNTHGHWWSSMVWLENRRMAAEFFEQVDTAELGLEALELCTSIARDYRLLASELEVAKEKTTPLAVQREALVKARARDEHARDLIRQLLPLVS